MDFDKKNWIEEGGIALPQIKRPPDNIAEGMEALLAGRAHSLPYT